MKLEQDKVRLDRVVKLARKKATGRPDELSEKLGISERSVYRIIQALKDTGVKIRYCKTIKTYVID
jgi:biotin operon repressor